MTCDSGEVTEIPRTPAGRRQHWDAKYASTAVSEVSWFQASPEQSRRLLAACGVGPHHSVVDVGGGASSLAVQLVEDGWTDVTVLDISAEALAAAQARCPEPGRIHWIDVDLLQWTPDRAYDVWHDRAVFHFLVEESDVATYRQKLQDALASEGSPSWPPSLRMVPPTAPGSRSTGTTSVSWARPWGPGSRWSRRHVRSTARRPVLCSPSPGWPSAATNEAREWKLARARRG